MTRRRWGPNAIFYKKEPIPITSCMCLRHFGTFQTLQRRHQRRPPPLPRPPFPPTPEWASPRPLRTPPSPATRRDPRSSSPRSSSLWWRWEGGRITCTFLLNRRNSVISYVVFLVITCWKLPKQCGKCHLLLDNVSHLVMGVYLFLPLFCCLKKRKKSPVATN
jgi:hypothetical protein